MKSRIIAITNQKGGVGKTSTLLALGAGLQHRGYKVLYVDLDPQGNASYTLQADTTALSSYSSLEVLLRRISADQAIQHTQAGDVIAASSALAGADAVITSIGKEQRLREALEELSSAYDYILIDTPPALGILTVNALTAAHSCIIPAQADIFSLQGIGQLNSTIEAVRRYCNPSLKALGVLLTRYNPRTTISKEVAAVLGNMAVQMNSKVFTSRIRECTAVKEAEIYQSDIYTYAPKSNAAADYTAFVEEFLQDQ